MDIHTRQVSGEPYALAGKRLIFTNWYYVRPGSLGWYDQQGRNVAVVGAQGPWEAQFRRQDYPHGVRLVAQPAQRLGPLLECERPWEDKGVTLNTVVQEGNLYRAWGSPLLTSGGASRFCTFQSSDGLTWERPILGLVEYEGRRDNNLLDSAGGTVFRDPSAPQDERYKWVDLKEISREQFEAYRQRHPTDWEPRAHRSDVQRIYGVVGAVSPDGLRWRTLPEPLVVEHSDTQPVAYYDQPLRKYVLYTRNWMLGPRAASATEEHGLPWLGVGRRAIGRSESDVFEHFSLSQIALEPGPEMLPSDALYTNCRTTIPGAPDQHLLFPAIWHTGDDTTSIALASSHDGRLWHFLPGSPVLETAPFGQWDGGCIFAHPNLLELPNGDFALPYSGYTFPHKYPRGQLRYAPGYALWPKGRLVALEAVDCGEFATVGLVPPGRRARINALTARAGGSIVVELAGLDGQPLPGRSFAESDPIAGDRYRTPLTWKGEDDLGCREGQAIMLRFCLEKARLFGLDFE